MLKIKNLEEVILSFYSGHGHCHRRHRVRRGGLRPQAGGHPDPGLREGRRGGHHKGRHYAAQGQGPRGRHLTPRRDDPGSDRGTVIIFRPRIFIRQGFKFFFCLSYIRGCFVPVDLGEQNIYASVLSFIVLKLT